MNRDNDIRPKRDSIFIDDLLKDQLGQGLGSQTKQELGLLMRYLFIRFSDLNEKSVSKSSLSLQVSETISQDLRAESIVRFPQIQKMSMDDVLKAAFVVHMTRTEL